MSKNDYSFPAMKNFLDKNGNPLETGKEYTLVTWGEYGCPRHYTEWIKAVWNGESLVDKEGMTWTEWLEDGKPSEDVLP